jgi:hypothetical protein
VQEKKVNEIDKVMSSYYGEEQVTAIINLKVDTKAADTIAEKVARYALVEDVFLVTGDTDIVVKTSSTIITSSRGSWWTRSRTSMV